MSTDVYSVFSFSTHLCIFQDIRSLCVATNREAAVSLIDRYIMAVRETLSTKFRPHETRGVQCGAQLAVQ